MRKLEVRLRRSQDAVQTVGTLAEERAQVYFQYDPEFLESGVSLSPFRLPLRAEMYAHKNLDFGPLSGVFDDSLPDGWGLLLMDRHFSSAGREPRGVSPLERLAWVGSRGMGALCYHPPAHSSDDIDEELLNIDELAEQSAAILSGEAEEVLPKLFEIAGSPGGARPKILVGYDRETNRVVAGAQNIPEGYEHWIVKFPSHNDSKHSGALEYAYSLMARKAGISMMESRLFETEAGSRFFGTQRFDRGSGNRRYHVHTLGGLIESNFRIPSADYADLLKATSVLTHNQKDVRNAFTQMVFNVLTHNRDDHVKNFAFILRDREWELSPAYDVCYSSGPGGEHTMTVAGEGREPAREHLQKLAAGVGVSAGDTAEIISRVLDARKEWKDTCDKLEIPSTVSRDIERKFLKIPR